MSTVKWFSVVTFILIVAVDVLGFLVNAGLNALHLHATIGIITAIVGLISMILVLRYKQTQTWPAN